MPDKRFTLLVGLNGSYDVITMTCDPSCDSAGYLVYATARLFMRSLDKELRRLNITAAQLAPIVAEGALGRKTRRGFYTYD